jgi:parvulin-like peptidyl-prolyl isomerase
MQYTRILFVGSLFLTSTACGPTAPPKEAKADTQTTATTPLPAEPSAPAPANANANATTSEAPKDPAREPGKEETEGPRRIGARHVLIQWMGADQAAPSVVRSKDQARAIAEEVLRRAKSGEDFARLAIEYSDEPGAGNRGGSLGRFGKGQMVGAFESAAFKLKVNEVSEIVETGFGYHVIQRTE